MSSSDTSHRSGKLGNDPDEDENSLKSLHFNNDSNINTLDCSGREIIPQFARYIPNLLNTFDFIKQVGSGTFSLVYLASLKRHPEVKFALKYILPTSHPSRTENELRCLKELGGSDNIIGLTTCVRHLNDVIIVMPHFHHQWFQDYVWDLSAREIQFYMRSLLGALNKIHHSNIIHRDVKPSNFLYNRTEKRFALIDFGLAQKVQTRLHQNKTNEKSSSTRATSSSSSSSLPATTTTITTSVSVNNFNNNNNNINKNNNDDDGADSENEENRPIIKDDFVKKFSKRFHKNYSSLKLALSSSQSDQKQCRCYGKPNVCRICLAKPPQYVARAGTPGFRPPEVLMKYPHQTTAVDTWAAGVIFLSLLCGKNNLIKSPDDMTSLLHITQLVGFQKMKNAASAIGKNFLCSPEHPPNDLKSLCTEIRKSVITARLSRRNRPDEDDDGGGENNDGVDNDNDVNNNNNNNKNTTTTADINNNNNDGTDDVPAVIAANFISALPDSTFELLQSLLDPNPLTRISASSALNHQYFSYSFD
ncbi:hypothetical protein HELRODRAFT_95512 [Helobdella robusta]|uniref:non-specific serine/threonine protein kinase n=1 Tax=Helobdella robusta TaxID=6412 RepID=T1G964_HELRO|nr:hypothetical protein HELRODRAFT_95512 [Helobdella robusta]ESN96602.1 hypothetical protein HELRODRAFT_95512 [Helobdella robusta]